MRRSDAIEKARTKAAGKDLDCRFEQLDVLSDTVRGGPFDFIFDRGCFPRLHVPALPFPHAVWHISRVREIALSEAGYGSATGLGAPRSTVRQIS